MGKLYFLTFKFGKVLKYGFITVCAVLVLGAILLWWGQTGEPSIRDMPTYYNTADMGEEREASKEGRVAIVIDDFGQSRAGVKEMLSIQRHLTMAVMPFLEFSKADAEMAHLKGHEVIVHLAMEPNKGKKSWLGPRPILSGMPGKEVEQIVRDSFETVPYAAGANIHMGSKASSEETIMSSVLDVMKEKKLYFLDSRTSLKPIAKRLADSKGVECYERNVFLDGTQSKQHIKTQLRKTGDYAQKYGTAVAIGHVGQEGGEVTAQAIKEILPEFDEKNIRLVYASELRK